MTKFLKLSGGWIRPSCIRWTEPHGNLLVVSVEGKERPVALAGEDAGLVRAYLDSRVWSPPKREGDQ